jgi:HEAT repeat protein
MRSVALASLFLLAGASVLSGRDAHGEDAEKPGGVAAVYGSIPADQVEFLSSADRIKAAAASGTMSVIWETLEHGERVECLDCIPAVEPLIYDADPRTREIAAWWLRRRTFGVFGPGEIYARTIAALAGAEKDPNPVRRAYAAQALGEFLYAGGVAPCAEALASDPDATVRRSAASALGRMGDDGKGALSKAFADADAGVRLAALGASMKVNAFSDVTGVARLLGDKDATVRRRAVEATESMRARESTTTLAGLARSDPDATVRGAACHALGALREPSVRGDLEAISGSDRDGFVRDMARMALRRL